MCSWIVSTLTRCLLVHLVAASRKRPQCALVCNPRALSDARRTLMVLKMVGVGPEVRAWLRVVEGVEVGGE